MHAVLDYGGARVTPGNGSRARAESGMPTRFY